MKKLTLLVLSIASFTACSETAKTQQIDKSTEQAPQSIGGQKDEHGCLTAAGQTWSNLRQTCLQIFNEGIRLNPIENQEDDAVISAFILLNNEETKAELFLAEFDDTFILDKNPHNQYVKGDYLYDPSNKTLYIKGEAKFKK